MDPPPSPMDTDPPASNRSRKRTASDISPTTTTPAATNTTPQILRRHHHRRRNVAASLWGPDLPITPAQTLYPTLPPPRFNIYKSLLRHPNLFFQFCIRLPYASIVSLYAIDKEFHYRLNKYSVSLMHDYARYHAPLASCIFSWALYPELCISDPMLRPMDGRSWLARDVPGFRWIGMVLWRQGVVRGILTAMAVEGHRVPAGVEAALCKFWVVMELKTAALRGAFLADTEIWSDVDIVNLQLFLVKLDMRFADPILGNGAAALAHLLLGQRSLSTLWYVLMGKIKLTYDTTTDLVIRTYLTEDLDADANPWIDDEVDNGVPEEWWGIQMRERWDPMGERMESAVDMIVQEGVRRELHVQRYLLDFVMYGHAPGKVVRRWRGNKGIVEVGGWPEKGKRQEAIRMLDERYGIVGSGTEGGRDNEMDVSV